MFGEFEDHSSLLFPLIVLNLTPDPAASVDSYLSAESKGGSNTWTYSFLEAIATELEVDSSLVNAYLPLLRRYDDLEGMQGNIEAQINSFNQQLAFDKHKKLSFVCKLIAYLMIAKLYDGRGRTLCFSIAKSFSIASCDVFFMEKKLHSFFLIHAAEVQAMMMSATTTDAKKAKRARYIRYAKIGSVAIGAGALIAVTGGLAAPAIAAALLVMGATTTVAAAASATTIACVLGATATGLSGYRMMRRTRGLSEFTFENPDFDSTAAQQDTAGLDPTYLQPALLVMVSGWMEKKGDYRRAIGIIPNASDDMSTVERLRRFYRVHAPQRVANAADELKDKQNDADIAIFFEQLTEVFEGRDPRHDCDLQPTRPYYFTATDNKTNLVLHTFLREFTMQMHGGDAAADSAAVAAAAAGYLQEAAAEEPAEEQAETKEQALVNRNLSALQFLDDYDNSQSSTSLAEGTTIEQQQELEHDQRMPCWHWRELPESGAYSLQLLRWETDLQLELGASITAALTSLASTTIQEVLSVTVLTTLAAAVFWPLLLIQATSAIDSTWAIAVHRADLAGKELARAILQAYHDGSRRPVTLVGYSVGARVVFSCCKELLRIFRRKQGVENKEEELELDDELHEQEQMLSEEDQLREMNLDSESTDAAPDDGTGVEQQQPLAPTKSRSSVTKMVGSMFGRSSSSTTATTADKAVADNKKPGETTGRSWNPFRSKKKNAHEDDIDELLAKLTDRDLKGLIEHVVLLGAPVSSCSAAWHGIRELVGGRVVNAYSNKDLVLGVLYRYQRFQVAVSGVSAVNVPGVEDIDLSEIVTRHTDYGQKMPSILAKIDLPNCRGGGGGGRGGGTSAQQQQQQQEAAATVQGSGSDQVDKTDNGPTIK